MSCSYYWTDHKKQKVKCEYMSSDPARLKTHLDEHKFMKRMSFRCSLCSYGMNTGIYLETHTSQCHEDWLYYLSEEEYALYKPKLVLNHTNQESKVYACSFVLQYDKRRYGCDFTSSNMKEMNQHIECHDKKLDRGYQCSLCKYLTELEDDCVEHCNTSHITMMKKQIIKSTPKPIPIGINKIKPSVIPSTNTQSSHSNNLCILSTTNDKVFYDSYGSSESINQNKKPTRDPYWTSRYDGDYEN